MQHLEVGSLILFGSTLRGSFVLNTVLVVGDEGAKYRASDGVDCGPEAFRTCTVEPLAARLTHVQKQNSIFTLYTGPSPARPVNGMFSFVPCHRVNGDFNQFARPTVTHGLGRRATIECHRGSRFQSAPWAATGWPEY